MRKVCTMYAETIDLTIDFKSHDFVTSSYFIRSATNINASQYISISLTSSICPLGVKRGSPAS